MANPVKDQDLDELLSAGEQPGSQRSYWVERELQRRREMAQREVDAKLMAAADAQIDAAKAAIEGAQAAKDTAWWTRLSAIAIAISVVVMAIGTWVDAISS